MQHRIRGSLLVSFLPALLSASAALADPPCPNDSVGAWHAVDVYDPVFTQPLGATAIWEPGAGAFYALEFDVPEGNLSCLTPAPCLVNNSSDGRAIVDFERYETTSGTFFAFAFSAGEAVEQLVPYLADEIALHGEMAVQQVLLRHLVDFETFSDGGRRWSALFRAGAKNQSLELDLTGTQLKARVEIPPEVPPVNRHLVDFEVLSGAFGTPHYAALFDDGTTAQQFFPSLTVDDFHDTAHDLHALGFRLTEMETFKSQLGEIRIAALFEETVTGGGNHLWALSCALVGNCQDPLDFPLMVDHLIGRAAKLTEGKPSLRLTNFEIPRGGYEVVIEPHGGGGGGSRRTDGLGIPRPILEKEKWQTPSGLTCNHAGVLHDAGTNGPP